MGAPPLMLPFDTVHAITERLMACATSELTRTLGQGFSY